MSSLNTCAIVIPVYKEIPNCSEQKSLIQAFKVLQKFKFYLICPNNLNVAYYLNASNLYQVDITITTFVPNYFTNITGYNKLLLSLDFYKKFTNFKFILIYQLDAWVFRNELNYWCTQNYDYIGAPWYEGFGEAKTDSVFLGVGNGGFSLRKIESHLKVLMNFAYLQSPMQLMRETIKNRGLNFRSIAHIVADFTIRNNTFFLFNNYKKNEDNFWGLVVPNLKTNFIMPSEETASEFSLEVNPSKHYQLKKILPFGCHAWEKYDKEFWQKFIHIDALCCQNFK